jgi:hypothetical protein
MPLYSGLQDSYAIDSIVSTTGSNYMAVELFCSCGECRFGLNLNNPHLSLLCGCEDCRQALNWGASQGGKTPSTLPELIYARSDIISVKGKKFMKAYHLREGAKSTRVYCNLCFSVLGVDFPGYLDNVFMFFKDHCDTSFDVAQLPVAAINMNDLADLSKVDVPPDVPVFHSFHFRQEYSRFKAIDAVAQTFKEPDAPAFGQTFRDFIKIIEPVEVLNLEKGA